MQHVHLKLAKLLLPAALGAGIVHPVIAQTRVTFEGLIDAYGGSMRSSGDLAQTDKISGGGMSTSYIGLKGSEDLGSGMQANFAVASFFRPTIGESGRFPGDTLFSRAANVGLSGAIGAVSLGRSVAPNTQAIVRFNPYGNSPVFSPLGLHLNVPLFNASGWTNSLAGDTGWSNQIRYTALPIAGLIVNLHYQFGETSGHTGKNNVGANLFYLNGPLSLTAFLHKVEVNNPLDTPVGIVKSVAGLKATRQSAWFIGASYDFKRAKLFATYDQTSHDIDLHDKTYSIGATVAAGSGEVMAAWAQTRRGGTGIADRERDTASLGYSYKLSRRTDLYSVIMNDRISNFESGNSIGAGIRHSF